jgi:hypothetical protein
VNLPTERSFGYLIAYVLPGFAVLWGLRPFSPTVDGWFSPTASFPAGIEAIVFVGMASIAAGMAVSAARWFVFDSLHAFTGLARPEWNDALLAERLGAFEAIVDAHYRYYQFYANIVVALPICLFAMLNSNRLSGRALVFWSSCFVIAELLFFVTSRDNLRKYYARTSRLLGEPFPKEHYMSNGHKPKPTKPVAGTPKPSDAQPKPSASTR